MLFRKIHLILFLALIATFVLYGIQINQKKTATVYAALGYPSHFFETRLTNNLIQPTVIVAAPYGLKFYSKESQANKPALIIQ